VASGGEAFVEMVFFDEVACGFFWQAMVADNYLISTIHAEIAALTGRSDVVDVSVYQYSFCVEGISF